MEDDHTTGNIKRRRESGNSPVLSVKQPKFVDESVPGLAMTKALEIDCSAPTISSKIDSKSIPCVSKDDQGSMLPSNVTKGLSVVDQIPSNSSNKGKKCLAPAQGRAKQLKQKREEERRRIELANQKRITDWISKAEKRREEKKEEQRQLEAMKKKKEEAARKEPFFLYESMTIGTTQANDKDTDRRQ